MKTTLRKSSTTQTSVLLVTHLTGTYRWTPLMMNLLRLSTPSAVLLPLHLMGKTPWILQLLQVAFIFVFY
jgi:hypothetical protein